MTRTRRAIVAAAVLIAAGAGGFAGYWRHEYGTPEFWAVPQELHYCGRDYGSPEHRAAMPRDGHKTRAFRFGPHGWQVYTQTWPGTPKGTCPAVLNLVHTRHDVVTYGLFGSP